MIALYDLFTSDVGLLSVFTILFIIVMAVYIYHFAMQKLHEEDAALGHSPAKPHSGA